MTNLVAPDRRPHLADVIRAIGYFHIALWSTLYLLHPSVQVAASLAGYTRLIWVGISGFGALVACIGAITGFDVKVELPGILFAAVGPLFYSVINIYFFFVPTVGGGVTDPVTRLALSALFVSTAVLLLPRALDLYSEGLRTRAMNRIKQK